MVSICPQVQSSYFIRFKELASSVIKNYSRRVSRTATLDGGSVVTDSGYTDTDRTLTIQTRITEAQETILKYLIQTYALLTVVTDEGCYTCAPSNLYCKPVAGAGDADATLTLLVQA